MDHALKRSTRRFHKTVFHISKFLACNAEKKNIIDEDNKKMNIAIFINIYTNIYIPILYVTTLAQN